MREIVLATEVETNGHAAATLGLSLVIVGELDGVVSSVTVGVVAADSHNFLEGLCLEEEVAFVVFEGEKSHKGLEVGEVVLQLVTEVVVTVVE